MARKPRVEVVDGIHHVVARGNGKQTVFLSDGDRGFYLSLLGRAVRRYRWLILAYCLMDNHVHVLIETPEPTLGAGMGWVQGQYAQTFNKRYKRTGHVFQDRFHSTLVQTDEQLWVTARYIAMNPVEAGLCGEPGAWVWSSHAATVGACAAPAWLDVARLRSYFGTWGGRYEEFVR